MNEDPTARELTWDQVFGTATGYWANGIREGYSYDGTKFPHAGQLKRAEEELALVKLMEEPIRQAMEGKRDLYFRVTAGAKAGTIMRLTNARDFKRADAYAGYRRTGHTYGPPRQSPVLEDGGKAYHWSKSNSGTITLDGYLYWHGDEKLVFEVDGRPDKISFGRQDSAMRTMKPSLLLDYQGPTVWSYGRPEKAQLKMRDRYGQEVGPGDVVLLGTSPSGVLLTGKISRMSDKGTLWIKHIGAKEEHKEMNCQSSQLLKLKDVEKVLMMEKLTAL